MSMVFLVLAIVCAVGVLAVLLVGFLALGRGGDFNKKYGNKLMQARIGLQAAAIAFVLLWWATKGA
jgi:NADH:ubiquinone oxidoreductase subunit 6 (subunit J)